MSELDKESLSALLDDEADELSLPRLLKSYDRDPEISEKWRRYSLVQAILHDTVIPVNPTFTKRVRFALAEEESFSRGKLQACREGLIKLAIAASVAVVCVLAGGIIFQQTVNLPQLAEQEDSELIATGPVQKFISENDTTTTTVDLEAQRLLEEYIRGIQINEEEPPLIQHIQDSPLYRLVNELQSRGN
jgi:hypothetical protein